MIIEVDAHPESRVHNSQPHGIGRVVALGGVWAWNNLGRNVVFAGEDFEPRAVFDDSLFSEDEPSQYDLDVHAIAEVPSLGIVVILNHLGMVRAFSSDSIRQPGPLRCVDPVWTRTFAADVERMVVLWDGALVWAAGCDRVAQAVDDYDWEALGGGGFAGLDPVDGRVVVRGRFPEDLAWGNGGVAVVCVPGSLCGIGRRGEVYTFDTTDGSLRTRSARIAGAPVGIAHASARGDQILYGFNRGGYRLHAIRVPRRA